MRQIEYFGRHWTVRFDTDKPLSAEELAKLKVIPRMGMTCTLTALDNGEVVTARSECSHKDVFRRELGEATSLKHALEVLHKAQVRNAFITLKKSDKSSRLSIGSSAKKVAKVEVATPAPVVKPVATTVSVTTDKAPSKPKVRARAVANKPKTSKKTK